MQNNKQTTNYWKPTILKINKERKAPGKGHRTKIYLECTCGNKSWVQQSDYKKGKSKRCSDCGHKERAKKQSVDETYKKIKKCWDSMIHRCLNKKNIHYKYYGGKGIKIDPPWLIFENFKKWSLNNGFKIGLTIERKDNNKNYCPENCCFIKKQLQGKNTSKVKLITHKGITMNQSDWAKKIGISQSQLSIRLSKGWAIEEALTIETIKRKPAQE